MSAVTSMTTAGPTGRKARATNDAGSSNSASHSSTRHRSATPRRICSPNASSVMTFQSRLEAWDLDTHLLRVGQLDRLSQPASTTSIDRMPARTVHDYENIIARLRAVPAYVDQNIGDPRRSRLPRA